jgi:hypothetical protein
MSRRARGDIGDAFRGPTVAWVGFVIAILFGLFLYWLRCRRRVVYGVAEIVVALLLIYTSSFQNVTASGS